MKKKLRQQRLKFLLALGLVGFLLVVWKTKLGPSTLSLNDRFGQVKGAFQELIGTTPADQQNTSQPKASSETVSKKVDDLTSSLTDQTKTLTNQAQEVGQHVQNIWNSSVQSKDQPPLHERATDYAKYEYCQAVVKSYNEKYN